MSRHSPTRLRTYLDVHENRIDQLLQSGFLLSADGLVIYDGDGCILLEGSLPCLGGIYINVSKRIAFLDDDESNPLVRTTDYSYNVTLGRIGVIFRYDSPHQDHRQEHHVHRYEVLSGDLDGHVDEIYDEEKVPVLAEVIEEAAEWYFNNLEKLKEFGIGG